MAPNIFGLVSEGLTNPLTEDLLANDFNALDFNEVHLNELHDNTGTGSIVVHEQFNMTNNKISNLADPTQNKDAATKQYVDSASSPTIRYDMMGAYTDETTPIIAGTIDTSIPIIRSFTLQFITGYINVAPTATSWTVEVFQNGTNIGTLFFNSSATFSASIFVGSSVSLNDRFTCSIPTGDATACGLKLAFLGEQI